MKYNYIMLFGILVSGCSYDVPEYDCYGDETRCDNGQVIQRCSAGKWETIEVCSTRCIEKDINSSDTNQLNEVDDDTVNYYCEKEFCKEGEKACQENKIIICKNNNWEDYEKYASNDEKSECSANEVCVRGECEIKVCEEKAVDCTVNSNSRLVCLENRWSVVNTCASHEYCKDGKCETKKCEYNNTKCSDDENYVLKCKNYEWAKIDEDVDYYEDCQKNGKICALNSSNTAECIKRTCEDGKKYCVDNSVVTCKNNELSDSRNSCKLNTICEDGECVACRKGEKRCMSLKGENVLAICNNDHTWEKLVSCSFGCDFNGDCLNTPDSDLKDKVIIFGKNDGINTNNPFEWRILAKNESQNIYLVMNSKCDTWKQYNSNLMPVDWETSDIRFTINSYATRMYFTDEELENIQAVRKRNQDYGDYSHEDRINDDKLFLLSYNEVHTFFGSYSDMNKDCGRTWWLRTSVPDDYQSLYVRWNGIKSKYVTEWLTIRPAMWTKFSPKQLEAIKAGTY